MAYCWYWFMLASPVESPLICRIDWDAAEWQVFGLMGTSAYLLRLPNR